MLPAWGRAGQNNHCCRAVDFAVGEHDAAMQEIAQHHNVVLWLTVRQINLPCPQYLLRTCAYCVLFYHTSHSVGKPFHHHLFAPSTHASLRELLSQHPYAQLSLLLFNLTGFLHAGSAFLYHFTLSSSFVYYSNTAYLG